MRIPLKWPARFEAEATRIREALGDRVMRIDHVGSTSVPGLEARPTVDIQLSLTDLIPRAAYVEPLVALGYRWALDPWTDEHEYFSLDENGERAVQIHACRSGSRWERRHLAFRDWLRDHPEDAEAYARIKRELAERHPRDIPAYVQAKTRFVRQIEAKALGTTVAG